MRTKTLQITEKVLDAAARLFSTRRFHEVRMEDIAVEAAVGKGTLYRYFSDKQDLYLALLARAADSMVTRVKEAVAGVTGSRDQLVAVVAAILDFFDAEPHVLDLILRAEVLRGPGREFPWQRTRDAVTRRVVAILEDGTRRGEFTVADPQHAMLMLLGGVRAVVRFGPKPRPRDLPSRLVDGILSGFGRSPLARPLRGQALKAKT